MCDVSTPLPRRPYVLFIFTMSRWMCAREGGEGWRFVEGFFLGGGGRSGRGRVVDGRRSTQFINDHSKVRKRQSAAGASLPPVVLDHVSQLDDELSLFVLLTALKRMLL